MRNKASISVVTAGALVAAAAVALSPAPASAAVAPAEHTCGSPCTSTWPRARCRRTSPWGRRHRVRHLRRAAARSPKSPGGTTRILATLPEPADGGIHTPVRGRSPDHRHRPRRQRHPVLPVRHRHRRPHRLWRIRPGGAPQRIAALPAAGLPNGLALDSRTDTLYVTDSVLGTIWSVPIGGGTPTVWSTAPELAPTGFLGANGLKIHNGAVWATNLDKGTILRIPILPDGRAGEVKTQATGLSGDRRLRLHRPRRPDPGRTQRSERGRPRPARRSPLHRPDRGRRLCRTRRPSRCMATPSTC